MAPHIYPKTNLHPIQTNARAYQNLHVLQLVHQTLGNLDGILFQVTTPVQCVLDGCKGGQLGMVLPRLPLRNCDY